LLQAVFEEIGGDRKDSRVLLQMLADCRAVRSLEIGDQPQSNARAKSLVISGLQDFFLEYMATKGGRTKEMQNAFEIVVCAIMSDACKTGGLRSALAEPFHLRNCHLDKALTQRQNLKDSKGRIRSKRATNKNKRNLQVARDYWHNITTRFDSFSPRMLRKWVGYKKYEECGRRVYYDQVS
jgi:hypothetical protein